LRFCLFSSGLGLLGPRFCLLDPQVLADRIPILTMRDPGFLTSQHLAGSFVRH
jgi:hypothetical protein